MCQYIQIDFDSLLRIPIKINVSRKSNKVCPVCLRSEDVRISGKKANVTQYLCKFCGTYFIPSTVHSEHKKIWHDKMFFKRIRLISKHLKKK